MKDLLSASMRIAVNFLRPPGFEGTDSHLAGVSTIQVPIRSLGENHRARIEQHLLSLSPQDRHLRFGYTAQDVHIQRYVAGLNFERDEIFGIYNRKLVLLAVAHLAYSENAHNEAGAEFGVSVLASARGRGYGARLFERAALHAGNDGVGVMFIHALSENSAMLQIARNAGALVQRDGQESEAFLKLPKPTLDSRATEMVEEQVAQTDYRIKWQAKQLWEFLANLQKIRQRV